MRCGRCTRLGFTCSFNEPGKVFTVASKTGNRGGAATPPSYYTPPIAGAGSINIISKCNSNVFDILDLELLQNCSTGLVSFLPPASERHFYDENVKVGLKYPYVLHSMLAVSALHLLHTTRRRRELRDKAILHYSAALKIVQPHLSRPIETHAIPLFLFSLHINVYGYGMSNVHELNRTYRGGGGTCVQPEDTLSQLCSCIRLARGLRAIVYRYWHSNIMHYLLPKMSRPPVKPGDDPEYARCPPLARLRGIVDCLAVHDSKLACVEAVDHLALLYLDTLDQAESERHAQWIQTWPVSISDAFFQLVEGRDLVALIVTAHYAALMSLKSDVWWLGNWPMAIVLEISQLLGHSAASEYLQWPCDMVQSPLKDS